MEGIVHVLLVHRCHEEANGADHDDGVGTLDGNDDIVEMLFLTDAQELHTALHDALGRVAVAVADAVGETTVVDADADSRVVLLTDIEEGNEAVLDLLQFCNVFLVGILMLDELAGGVDVVAGVDADFLGIEGGDIGDMGVEMDIGHEGRLEAVATDTGIDILQILGLAGALCRQTDELATGADDLLSLTDAGLGVVGVRCRHTLYAHGEIAAHVEGTDMYGRGRTTGIIEQINHIVTDLGLTLKLIVLDLSEVLVGLLDLRAETGLPGVDLLGNLGIAEGHHLSGEDSGVLGAVDTDGSHGDPRWHLDDGEHGVETVEHTLDRHTDNGQRRGGGDNTGEGGSHAGTGDDDTDATGFGAFGEGFYGIGRSVGRESVDLKGNLLALEPFTCFFHHGQITR